MTGLNQHIAEIGCTDTVLYDPSGFDLDARTTVLDLKTVVDRLLENSWFRDIVCQSSYTAILPDGSTQTWKNTNTFLDPESEYYNENVIGIKTGSLSDDYNLVVLYRQHGKEFLICSLGSSTTTSRYDDVSVILKTIDESNYLSGSGTTRQLTFQIKKRASLYREAALFILCYWAEGSFTSFCSRSTVADLVSG